MTLIITEISSFGIAMVADSAVTVHAPGQLPRILPNAAQKLQTMSTLNAGVACWGLGTIGNQDTDQWLSSFLASSQAQSVGQLATALETGLKLSGLQPNSQQASLGFHVAGYETVAGITGPSFYHVHDGPSTTLAAQGIQVNPAQFNANHDFPPTLATAMPQGGIFMTRNGDFRVYAALTNQLVNFFSTVQQQTGLVFPHSQSIGDRAEFLLFQLRMMADIYRMSNVPQIIGGNLHFVTIDPSGIRSHGIRYL